MKIWCQSIASEIASLLIVLFGMISVSNVSTKAWKKHQCKVNAQFGWGLDTPLLWPLGLLQLSKRIIRKDSKIKNYPYFYNYNFFEPKSVWVHIEWLISNKIKKFSTCNPLTNKQ